MNARGMTYQALVWIAVTLVCTGLVACNPNTKVTDKNVHIIDDVELAALMASDKPLLIIDARPDYRYRLGHLPGAINTPLPELKKDDARFSEKQHLVVYGDGPDSTLSHAAAKKLLANPKLTVSDFRGGMALWEKAGREVVTGN